MYRGTTPTINLITTSIEDLNYIDISDLYVTFMQNEVLIIEKTLSDVTLNLNTISMTLTQEETLLFDFKKTVNIQVRIKCGDNCAICSNIVNTTFDKILKEGVI